MSAVLQLVVKLGYQPYPGGFLTCAMCRHKFTMTVGYIILFTFVLTSASLGLKLLQKLSCHAPTYYAPQI